MNGYFRFWWSMYTLREKRWIGLAVVELACIVAALVMLWGRT